MCCSCPAPRKSTSPSCATTLHNSTHARTPSWAPFSNGRSGSNLAEIARPVLRAKVPAKPAERYFNVPAGTSEVPTKYRKTGTLFVPNIQRVAIAVGTTLPGILMNDAQQNHQKELRKWRFCVSGALRHRKCWAAGSCRGRCRRLLASGAHTEENRTYGQNGVETYLTFVEKYLTFGRKKYKKSNKKTLGRAGFRSTHAHRCPQTTRRRMTVTL
jgi:hypothetical protein